MSLLKSKTKITRAYAGYYRNVEILKTSASGGISSYFSTKTIEDGGIVYGATYSTDYYYAHYLRVDNIADIDRLKGSKYCYVRKIIYINGTAKSVFEMAAEDIIHGKKVLFIGLSCDIAALIHYLRAQDVLFEELLQTIELLCAGVTEELVQREYVRYIEYIHKSKVIDFTVRNKKDGWNPIYMRAILENGKEHIIPFYESVYGKAFMYYKRRACYECKLKALNRYADLTIGDYRGCEEWMPEYNEEGTSIIYVQSDKGQRMMESVDSTIFKIIETDIEFALRHSPRYFSPTPLNQDWDRINSNVNSLYGLFRSFRNSREASRQFIEEYKNKKNIVLWGAGDCYHKLGHYVLEFTDALCVVDEDANKWSHSTEYGLPCVSPDEIRGKDVIVIIMIEYGDAVSQVINKLISINIKLFIHVRDWIAAYETL